MEHVSAVLTRVLDDLARRSGRDSRPLSLPFIDQPIDLSARKVERRRERIAHLGVRPVAVQRHPHLLRVETVCLGESLHGAVPRPQQRPQLVGPAQVPREAAVNNESVAHSYLPTVPWEGFTLAVSSTTGIHSIATGTHSVKGCDQVIMPSGDRELVEALVRLMRDRDLAQTYVAERTGIGQSTISRLVRTIEEGEELPPLRPRTREALAQFVATADVHTRDRAAVLSRHLAANLLEELAELLRRGADQAPDEDSLPPTIRRLLGGEAATGSDADAERQAARLERMAAQQEEMRERRRQERRTGER